MEAEQNNQEKPFVRICAACQNAGEPGYEALAFGIDQSVKDELQQVNKQIKAHSNQFEFSHGSCEIHTLQSYSKIEGMTPERMASVKEKLSKNPDKIQCLLTDKALRHGYMRGLFTPEQIKQAAHATQQSNEQLTERFRKLAGIKL